MTTREEGISQSTSRLKSAAPRCRVAWAGSKSRSLAEMGSREKHQPLTPTTVTATMSKNATTLWAAYPGSRLRTGSFDFWNNFVRPNCAVTPKSPATIATGHGPAEERAGTAAIIDVISNVMDEEDTGRPPDNNHFVRVLTSPKVFLSPTGTKEDDALGLGLGLNENPSIADTDRAATSPTPSSDLIDGNLGLLLRQCRTCFLFHPLSFVGLGRVARLSQVMNSCGRQLQ